MSHSPASRCTGPPQETLSSGEPSIFNELISRETAEENSNAQWVGTTA